MKRALYFLVFLVIIAGCRKEVARKYYILTYQFSSGEKIEMRGRIFEKDKEYKSKDGDDVGVNLKIKDPDQIIFGYIGDTWYVGHQRYHLYKTKEGQLVGSWPQKLKFDNFSFANCENMYGQGSIALEGDYKSPYRKFTVENGTFTYKWANAEEYGMNDTILSGTWTLKRE